MKNETALITGSTSGIGKKLAETFLNEGCKVCICSRNPEKVQKTFEEYNQLFPGNVIGISANVTDPQALKKAFEKTVQEFGSVRILVANAGINLKYGPFDHMPPKMVLEDATAIVNTNLIGVINTISAALPHMKAQNYGRIIALSGGGVDRPITHMTLYSASKGGVVTFAKCFAEELKSNPEDIKINLFQPGMLKTGLTSKVTVVPNWDDAESVEKDTDTVIKYLGAEISESTAKVIPYVLPSCKDNGKLFRGYSLPKLIIGAMKLQKYMKNRS